MNSPGAARTYLCGSVAIRFLYLSAWSITPVPFVTENGGKSLPSTFTRNSLSAKSPIRRRLHPALTVNSQLPQKRIHPRLSIRAPFFQPSQFRDGARHVHLFRRDRRVHIAADV